MNIRPPTNWQKESWQKKNRVQQPDWQDHPQLKSVCKSLEKLPPLVFAGEIASLRKDLSEVEKNNGIFVQCGDCAETFDQCSAPIIRENLKILLQMSIVLTFAAGKKVVKIGRLAGQYAKPRSSPYEEVDGQKIPVYRGDMVNCHQPDLAERQPDPNRMLQSYFHATATLNLLRGYTRGGFADLGNTHRWNKEFVKDSKQGQKYEELASQIDKNLTFINAIGLNRSDITQISQVDLYTSHEALILEYEQALTRKDSLSGTIYDCSAHMLWIGNRTKHSDGAHVEFLKGVANPIGIKVGADCDIDDLKRVIDKLNPHNESGKIVIIARLGAQNVERSLPNIVSGLSTEGYNLTYCSDPMHGNTVKSGKYKTRKFEVILDEILLCNKLLKQMGKHLGGIHIEATGLDVTECTGGAQEIDDLALNRNYATSCDPRLNASQSVELAFLLAEHL